MSKPAVKISPADHEDALLDDLVKAQLSGRNPVDVVIESTGVKYPSKYLRWLISRVVDEEVSSENIQIRKRAKMSKFTPVVVRMTPEMFNRKEEISVKLQERRSILRSSVDIGLVKYDMAMELYDDFKVRGTPLGDCTKEFLDQTVGIEKSHIKSRQKNVTFFSKLSSMLEAGQIVREGVSIERATAIRDEAYQ